MTFVVKRQSELGWDSPEDAVLIHHICIYIHMVNGTVTQPCADKHLKLLGHPPLLPLLRTCFHLKRDVSFLPEDEWTSSEALRKDVSGFWLGVRRLPKALGLFRGQDN